MKGCHRCMSLWTRQCREGRSIRGSRAALCQGGGGGQGRKNTHVLITFPVSKADTW